MNIAVIIAKKNSKRLKKKNFYKIGNKNLIQRAVVSAIDSKIFHKIIINSDIADISKAFKFLDKKKIKKIYFLNRKKYLASDKAKSVDVVIDTIRSFNFNTEDKICLLLPTCPLRSPQDIKSGFKFFKKDISCVISLCETNFPSQFSFIINKKKITPLIKNNPLLKKETRTQDIQTTYRPNGAFYISKVKTILKNKNFFHGKLAGFVMPKNRSIDIDTFEDLQLARLYYKNTKK